MNSSPDTKHINYLRKEREKSVSEFKFYRTTRSLPFQGSHRLEKYLNLEGFLEKSLKITSAMKSTGKSLKSLEKSLNSTISVGLSTVDRGINKYKMFVPIFGAAYFQHFFLIF